MCQQQHGVSCALESLDEEPGLRRGNCMADFSVMWMEQERQLVHFSGLLAVEEADLEATFEEVLSLQG